MTPQQELPAPKTLTIKFFKGVDGESINTLMSVIEQRLRDGVRRFALLISCPGGTVFHGLSAYNFLKGIPAEVVTHNFGSVDSIGVVLYCAGTKRYSVPHARFLLHGVQANFPQPCSLEEKQLEERLKGLQIDMLNVARVVAANTGKTEEEVNKAMLNRTTLDPNQSIAWGLVHEIKTDLFLAGGELISIQ